MPTAHLGWNANPEPDIDHYNLYVGAASGDYTTVGSPQNMGNTTDGFFVLPGQGVFYFALTAVNASGLESNFSDEISSTFTDPDTQLPIITITSPTPDATYTTSVASVVLAGTASDNVAVDSVSWTNDRGGSGLATGTTSWSTPPIDLFSGANTITVTALDTSGNTRSDVLIVFFQPITQPLVASANPTCIFRTRYR